MHKIPKHILLWSFAAFFLFAGSGLNLFAHCHNKCEIETKQQPTAHCNDNTDCCHLHRLSVDNTIVTAQKFVPDTKFVCLLNHHFTNTSEPHYINVSPRVFSSSPKTIIANRDLLVVISCFII